MKRFLRRSVFWFVPAVVAALAFAVPASTSGVGLESTNLACNDDTNLNLAVDASSLTALSDAVSAIGVYPAGLSCSLSQTADPGNPNMDFAVGGGRTKLFSPPYGYENFALNFRVPATENDMAGFGHFNLVLPASESPNGEEGRVDFTIDCVNVKDNDEAQAEAHVTRNSGALSFFTAPVHIDVFDSKLAGGVGDLISFYVLDSEHRPCEDPYSPASTVDYGNISVHFAPAS